MIVVDKNSRNPRYLINESAVSFTENYQGVNQKGNPIYDVVAVSIVSNAAIMVYDENNGIGYGNDLQYQRWRLNGATTGLVSAEAHNIYARLSRGDKKEADIIFSVRNYNTDGSIVQENGEKTEPSDTYYYILIGTITALTDVNAAPTRTLTFDPGYLSSQKSNNEQGGGWVSKMFDIVVDKVESILVKLPFNSIRVLKDAIFEQAATFLAGLKLGSADQGKIVTSVATDLNTSEDSKEAIATPAYVKAFSEGRYLRYDIKDEQTVKGPINFESNVSVGGDHDVSGNQTIKGELNITKNGTDDDKPAITIGNFIEQGDIIQGAQVTKDGIASFAKVKTPSMQVYELTLNRKTAVQGEFVFSDGETIEEVTRNDDGTYQLRVREPYEGYITTFKVNDILYSNINIIGESAKTGKCWMYVTAVDGNKITAVHYPYEACPAGENIAPMPHMTITRHGNRSDKTRQDLFIISSETSSLTMLRGVNAPIVSSEGLYGVVVGKLPKALLEYVNNTANYVNGEDPYVYARGAIVQDFIMLDYQGKPIPTERYRGDWSLDIAKGLVEGEDKYRKTGTLVDTVTHKGSLWQCMYDGTTAEPQDNSEYWLKKVSKGEDGDMPTIFTITSSLTSIHQDSSGKLNTNILDIWVNAVGAPSNFEIKDQATLDAYGLSVWFNIDEQEDVRTKLTIGGADSIEVEEGGAIIVAEDDDDDGGAYITLESESIDISSVREKINIYLVRDANEEGFGVDENRMYIPVMRDGQRGRMLYPAGVYDSTKKYMIENNSAPFVKEGETYYVLVYEGGEVTNIDPADDYANNGGHWKPFTYMNYLFAEFLMANWAQFGGENGGVFYDRYLFSQKGTNSYGNEASYSKDMFDDDGKLSGKFTPALMFDFLGGEAILGKLTEVYHRYPSSAGLIRMGDYHNIIVTPDAGKYGESLSVQGFSSPLIILPQMKKTKWPTNGAHISIFSDVGDYYKHPLEGLNAEPVGGLYKQMSSFALISADDILDGRGLRTGGGYEGNWIIANGYRAKFMLLSPGCMIKLRLSYNENTGTTGDETYNWVVEGGNEVLVTKSQIFASDLHWSSESEATRHIKYEDYDWERINNQGATLEYNWSVGDDVNHPYYPVILTVGHVGDNLGVTNTSGGAYLGHTKPNILLSTTTNEQGWYGGCYYRLVDAVDDKGYPDTDLE